MTDWQLIQAYVTGDDYAFTCLVEKYYQLVYRAACRQVSDMHLAEDIAQCVFLLFARKAKALSPATAIGGWFLRTVRFVARDVTRKSRRWQRLENDEALIESMAKPSQDPTGPLASLEEAVLALSSKEQTCLLARFYEGKSLREIAEELSISEDAAEKRVARALDKMRLFFQRRGWRVGVATIPVILSAGYPVSVQGAFAQTGTLAVVAAVKGKGVSAGVAALTAEATRILAWNKWTLAGAKIAAALLLVAGGTGWVWVNREPSVPPRAAFQISDTRIATLGKNWSQVMQRAARVRHEFPQPPDAADSRRPALQAENQSLFRDRMALSWGLQALDQEQGARAILPAYVTSGLSELLALSPAQSAFIFDAVQRYIPYGIKEKEGSYILEANKPAIAAAVRGTLSIRQKWRFDEVCGVNGEFLLINRTSYGRALGYMAWQDWLGGGGIITPEEAMAAVPPNLW